MWSISARNITQAGQDATNRSKTSPKIIVVALAEVLRTPNKGNQYQIEVGQNTPPSKPWLESLTYFLAGVIAGHELVEVGALERLRLERVVNVRAVVEDPQLLGPRLLTGGFGVEEQDVGLDALGVEDAG